MEIIQTIAFDITTPGITPRIYGKQGDATSRQIRVNMYHGGEEWEIPSGAALAVRYKTPSGASGLYDTIGSNTAIMTEGNQITAMLATPIFAEAGPTSCELVITDSTGATSTWRFLVMVEAASVSDTEIPEDYYNAFLGMAAEVKSDADRAQEAANSIDTSYLMSKTMYDPAGAVEAAGGIPKYVAAQTLTGDYIPTSQKGAESGVATLGTDGKIPSSQLSMSDSISSSSTTTIASSAAVKAVNDKIPTLSNSVSSTSTTTAASSYAVKLAYDKASSNGFSVVTTTPTINVESSVSSYTIKSQSAMVHTINDTFSIFEAEISLTTTSSRYAFYFTLTGMITPNKELYDIPCIVVTNDVSQVFAATLSLYKSGSTWNTRLVVYGNNMAESPYFKITAIFTH